ncbi:MAG: hypothetical protein JWP27_397 [Flaviaesturariibacter sp.]|nr:hypothetical protein [Flaviaesturariibacter sp.]
MDRADAKKGLTVVAVFSHTASPRLLYVLDFLSDYYGLPFRLATDPGALDAEPRARIAYTVEAGPGSLHIVPHGLLSATGTAPVETVVYDHEAGYKAFFRTGGDTGFDVFAAIFWLLSRYEEYSPHETDAYGRYAVENSLAFRAGFLKVPLVNRWLEDLRKRLVSIDPSFPAATPPLLFQPTYDIDMAWSFRGKGAWRNTGGFLRSLALGRPGDALTRIRVLLGQVPDPFDCYAWLDDLHDRYGLRPVYFFHVCAHRNRYDKSIPAHVPSVRALIRETAGKARIGLHPSWHSGDAPAALLDEKKALEEAVGQPVDLSRQHYIRFSLPGTFRQLVAAGIHADFSMGYGSCNGFRASVAAPFRWYDLERDEVTALVLHPFCFMDANAFYEQKMSPAEGLEELNEFRNEISRTGGILLTIWHNSFLGTDRSLAGWREMYERVVSCEK